jgi:hypothetical protein
MSPRVDDREAGAATDKRKEEALAQETHERAAGVDDEDYDEDPTIWNLNRMGRLNLRTPEWIENAKKERYENVAFYNKSYDDLQNDDGEEADEAAMAEFDLLCKNIFANIDLSGLNSFPGGVDPVAVYPREEDEDRDHDAAADADVSVCSYDEPKKPNVI